MEHSALHKQSLLCIELGSIEPREDMTDPVRDLIYFALCLLKEK
jgi:hypothetical protein